ncbi:MAG: ATP-binding cassette domain-containing protein [Nocardioidaceae bacterium]
MTDLATRVADSPPDTQQDLAIRTTGLTRRFGSHTAVDAVDMTVPRGAVYGFLGPNGSGKTTTIRMLLGLMAPHAGTVDLLGGAMPSSSQDVLPRVGTLVEGPAFHPYLSGAANLRRLDAFDATTDPATGTLRIDEALHRVGLTAAAGKKFRRYSLGMKQRLGLAATLLRPRDLLILDEPTNGLDPQGTREVRSLIRELAADGTTVLVSSHLLAEIEQVATHVGIMSAGRLLKQGRLADVLSDTVSQLRVRTPSPADAAATLTEMGLSIIDVGTESVTARLDDTPPEQVNAALVRAGVPVRGFAVELPALEDLFVSLTGEGFDVVG